MELKHFQTLLEVESINREIKKHEDKISSNQDRVLKIEKEREKKGEELEKKKELLRDAKIQMGTEEKALYKVESQIEKSNEHMKKVTSEQQARALEAELTNLEPRATEHESLVLELMEKVDLFGDEIEVLSNFVAGSGKTLEEVQEEVSKEVVLEESHIERCNEKVANLLTICPHELKDAYISLNKRYRHKEPVVFVIENKCSSCKYTINRNTQSLVEKGNIMEFCPGCGRLIVPHAATS